MKCKVFISKKGFTPSEGSIGDFRDNKTPTSISRCGLWSGFTLVETLVAISILLIVIIGPMTVAQKGIQNAYFAREQVTAVFLAQEAIEAVREFRDSNGLEVYATDFPGAENAWSWYDSIHDDCKGSTGCAYNLTSGGVSSFDPCSAHYACQLRLTSGNYDYEPGGTPSPFTRKVYIKSEALGVVSVTVEVSWNTKIFGGAQKAITLQTWLYNQYMRYEN